MTPKARTFKELVKMIAECDTREELNEIYSLTEFSYQHEKITFKDEQILLRIISKASYYFDAWGGEYT